MAKFELKFKDFYEEKDFVKAEHYKNSDTQEETVCIEGNHNGYDFLIMLDKSTAIKFAKTLRTEINKITESEGNNG